jgi:hypothetical protein
MLDGVTCTISVRLTNDVSVPSGSAPRAVVTAGPLFSSGNADGAIDWAKADLIAHHRTTHQQN